jgi:dTDP-4-amino-4,6-dideoxygalactose transaminase
MSPGEGIDAQMDEHQMTAPKTERIRTQFLPFAAPLTGEEEVAGVVECVRSGWLTTGLKVKEFEQAFAAAIGCRHALAVNSCTAALHLALEAIGVGEGDEVLTSPMTFTATAAVIEHLRARPVFVDVQPDTLNLDPERLEAALSPRTRAILPVHFAGQACEMDPILALARARGLQVVEDAAHALPTRYRGRLIGTLSDLTCFSFYATKNLTTGEGGMVVTDDDRYAERVRLMHLHGMSRDAWKRYLEAGSWAYEVLAPGFKYNLSDLAAAIGIPQLRHCDAFHARRRAIARRYHQALQGLEAVRVPQVADEASHAWHLYVIQLELGALSIDRDQFIRELTRRKIGVSVHFIPLHLQPYYRDRYGYAPGDFPNAYRAFQRIISLPIYAKMSDDDVEDVIAAVSDIAEAHRR